MRFALFLLLILTEGGFFVNAQQKSFYKNEYVQSLINSEKDSIDTELELIVKANRSNADDTTFYRTLALVRDYYSSKSLNQKTVRYGIELIQLAKKLDREKELAKHYNRLSQPLNVLGEYGKQYEFAEKAKFYAEKHEDTIQWIVAIAQLGTFYWHIDELELAVESNRKAFKLCESYPEFDRRAILLNNRATYYYASEKYPEALTTLKSAIPLMRTNYDSTLVYHGLGVTYYLMDSLSKSHYYLEKSHNINPQALKGNYVYYLGLLAFKENEYDKSEKLLLDAIELLKRTSSIQYLQESYQTLYAIYTKRGEVYDALRYLELSNTFKDSINATQNVKELARKNYNRTLLIKEREKAEAKRAAKLLQKKVDAEKNARLYSNVAVIVSAIALVFLIFWGLNFRKLQRLKQERMQKQFSDKMELKNKELASVHIRNINRSNYLREADDKLSQISGKIETGNSQNSEDLSYELQTIKRILNLNSQQEWDDFRYYFEEINDSFFAEIRARYPRISTNDEKIIAYIKVGLDSKQISRLLNVTQNTVRTQKYRLRKKMNLPPKTDLRRHLDLIYNADG